jgi:hypothetical protein
MGKSAAHIPSMLLHNQAATEWAAEKDTQRGSKLSLKWQQKSKCMTRNLVHTKAGLLLRD